MKFTRLIHKHCLVDRYHHALHNFHLRSSEHEVTHALHLAGAPQHRYAIDRDFELYVYKEVITFEQVMAVVAMLNADRHAMENSTEFVCQKTHGLPKDLKESMAKYSLSGAYYLSSIRRICCCCHDVGSFQLSTSYNSKMHRLYKDKNGDSIWYTGCK